MSNNMTEKEKKQLLEEFEKMLQESFEDENFYLEGDFGYYNPDNIKYPNDEDLQYPEEPPPIPKNVKKCSHKNKYKNTANGVLFWVCKTCKADLGNVKKEEK